MSKSIPTYLVCNILKKEKLFTFFKTMLIEYIF